MARSSTARQRGTDCSACKARTTPLCGNWSTCRIYCDCWQWGKILRPLEMSIMPLRRPTRSCSHDPCRCTNDGWVKSQRPPRRLPPWPPPSRRLLPPRHGTTDSRCVEPRGLSHTAWPALSSHMHESSTMSKWGGGCSIDTGHTAKQTGSLRTSAFPGYWCLIVDSNKARGLGVGALSTFCS
jgi:hypothetical protein